MNYSDPLTWDEIWEQDDPARIVARLSRSRDAHPDWHARYAHALAAAGQLDEAADQIDVALELYEGQPGMNVDLLRAVRLQVMNGASRYADVVRDARDSYGLTPRALEAGCLTQYALGYAHMYLGDLPTALLHAGQALALSNALELSHRRRAIQLLWSHLLNAMGRAVPRQVLMNIANSPHQRTAEHGALRIVESHLYAGEYHLAAEFAERRGLVGAAQLARGLMREFPAAGEGAGGWYDDMTDGLRAASELRYEDIPVIETDATALGAYARLLNALRSLRAGARANFEAMLGAEPGQPDQRAYWACIRLFAALDGAIEANPAQLTSEAVEALLAVPHPTYVIRTLEAISPRAVLLLSHAPDTRIRALFSGLTAPLLVSDYVSNHTRIEVPSVIASHLILQSLGSKSVVNGGYTTKYRKRLLKHGMDHRRVVVIGELYRHAEAIQRSATGGMAEAWGGVLIRMRRTSPLLDRALKSRLRD